MRIIKSISWIVPLIIVCACGSDNLTNSKAKNIISECFEKEPLQRSVSVHLNNTQIYGDDISKYEKLKDEGYIEITPKKTNTPKPVKKQSTGDPLADWRNEAALRLYERELERNKNTYIIKLTKKAEKYIERAHENSNTIVLKTFKYEVDKVLEVQEIPAMNAAKVKVQYVAEDITPFAILSPKDPSEFLIEDLNMTKTSNGWKYCDDF